MTTAAASETMVRWVMIASLLALPLIDHQARFLPVPVDLDQSSVHAKEDRAAA
jgi:hypothetical protein